MDILKALVLLLISLTLLGSVMWLLRERNSAQVRMMWFAFSVMYVLCGGFIIYATKEKWIASDGNLANTKSGELISKGLDLMLDLGGELTAIAYTIGGIVLIYFITYLATAAFGCASRFSVISGAVDVATLFFLKGFASVAAILMAILSCNVVYHWFDVGAAQAIAGVGFSLGVFGLGFGILCLQIEKSGLISWLESRMPTCVLKLHEKSTRHSRNELSLLANLANASPELAFLLAQNRVQHREFQGDMLEMIALIRATASGEAPAGGQADSQTPQPPSTNSANRASEMRIAELRKKWGIEDVQSAVITD